jgi:hypothetical protein
MRSRVFLHVSIFIVPPLVIAGCCCAGISFGGLDASDLVGTWTAEYAELDFRGCGDATGVETLTLRGDGTYQQAYHDRNGYVYVSPWNKWYMEDERGTSVIHLEGGRFYPLGVQFAEALAHGRAHYHSDDDGRGNPLDLDGTQVIVYAYASSGVPGGLYLEYPPVCDPDSPTIVHFYLTATPSPDSTVSP